MALDTPDGINTFIFALASELLGLGHEVTVVGTTLNDRTHLESLYTQPLYPDLVGLSAETAVNWRPATVARLWRGAGRRVVDDLRPDLVVVNGAVPVRFRSRTAIVVHDLELRYGRLAFLRDLYKKYTYGGGVELIATCSEIKAALADHLGLSPQRIRVIPTCIEVGVYQAEARERRERTILHMGTAPYKNPVASINAFARMSGDADRLWITGPETPEVASALAALTDSVRTRVDLVGHVATRDLRRMLSVAAAVAVPSDYAVPVASPTVLEAFASGTPVVCSTSISRDLVVDGSNGHVRDSSDVAAFADALHNLLADRSSWERLAAGALATAERFSARVVAQQYLELVERAGRM